MSRCLLVLLLAGCSAGGGRSVTARTSGGDPPPDSAAPTGPGDASAVPSQPAGRIGLEKIGDFDAPVWVGSPPGDTHDLFVVERTGRVRVVHDGQVQAAPYLDLTGETTTGGERGLLSIAFAPDYAQSGRMWADYTDLRGNSHVTEWTRSGVDPLTVDPASRRELLSVDQPFSNHNGGLLLVDPSGMLLIGLGDGGSGGDPENRAQNLSDLLGKILRIDPRPVGDRPYGIPPDNPFVHRPGARPEIWAYGLRNPWRFFLDPPTGDLWLGDVGQNKVEEVDLVPVARQPGANYGWSVFEGRDRFNAARRLTEAGPLITPVLTYGHENNQCSVTSGEVYHGSIAALQGRYLYGDFCSGQAYSVSKVGDGVSAPQRLVKVDALASFGHDASGEVYLADLAGPVSRLVSR